MLHLNPNKSQKWGLETRFPSLFETLRKVQYVTSEFLKEMERNNIGMLTFFKQEGGAWCKAFLAFLAFGEYKLSSLHEWGKEEEADEYWSILYTQVILTSLSLSKLWDFPPFFMFLETKNISSFSVTWWLLTLLKSCFLIAFAQDIFCCLKNLFHQMLILNLKSYVSNSPTFPLFKRTCWNSCCIL